MTDRELLELAAKAAGLPELRGAGSQHHCYYVLDEQPTKWNPLKDDGDALRLAVKVNIELEQVPFGGRAILRDEDDYGEHFDEMSEDRYAATRRAIVRAAAEIGKGMP